MCMCVCLVLCVCLSLPGFVSHSFAYFKHIFENSAKRNASLCLFPSAVLCEFIMDTLLIKGGVVNSCGFKTCGCRGNLNGKSHLRCDLKQINLFPSTLVALYPVQIGMLSTPLLQIDFVFDLEDFMQMSSVSTN